MNELLNVVCSIPSLTPEAGGPSRSTTALCSALAHIGVQVRLVTLDYGTLFKAPLLPDSERVETKLVPCLSARKLRVQWSPKFKKALFQSLPRSSPELLHDNGLWAFTNHATASAARQSGLPLVLSTRGMLAPWALKYKSWKKKMGWHLYQYRDLLTAAVFHATSQQEAEGIRQLGFRQPIAIIPNGVEIPETRRNSADRCKTALFLGRIHPVKGLLPFVEAWSKVRPSGWRVLIAGPDEGGHRATVEAAIQAAGLTDTFEFSGMVDGPAKAKLLQGANLFIMPSYTENFGIAVAEALANGLPVITTKGTPWNELPAKRCGWWVDATVDGLSSALEEATRKQAEELELMGARGRQFVEQEFAWRRIATDMRSVYEWVLKRGPMPTCIQM